MTLVQMLANVRLSNDLYWLAFRNASLSGSEA
jgi:hypothetical protein